MDGNKAASSQDHPESNGLKKFKESFKIPPEIQQVWTKLECPICFEIVTPPIYICEQGHHNCHRCLEAYPKCPTCKGQKITTRNFTLESIVKKLPLPCVNALHGCNVTAKLEDRVEHAGHCAFSKLFNCFLPGCDQRLFKPDLINHLQNMHGALLATIAPDNLDTVSFSWRKIAANYIHICEISGWGYFVYQHTPLSIMFIGEKYDAAYYTYSLRLQQPGKYISFPGNVISIQCESLNQLNISHESGMQAITLTFKRGQFRPSNALCTIT